MTGGKAEILVVDDERFNLEILLEHLEEAGDYISTPAEDGVQAWELLEKTPEKFSAVLLDRMMPRMGGMEVLEKIKNHEKMKMLPVIMQTAKASKQDVLKGLEGGAYYYLTKPFEKEALIAILRTAVSDYHTYIDIQAELREGAGTIGLISSGSFSFKTLRDGKNLATLLANACPNPDKVVMGLNELFVNSVEHGNLGITYDDKSALNDDGAWEEEVERRQALPENASKLVKVTIEKNGSKVSFVIKDEGNGFDWNQYLEISPERAFDTHGRGIAMANGMSFSRLEYQGNGNEVIAVIAS